MRPFSRREKTVRFRSYRSSLRRESIMSIYLLISVLALYVVMILCYRALGRKYERDGVRRLLADREGK